MCLNLQFGHVSYWYIVGNTVEWIRQWIKEPEYLHISHTHCLAGCMTLGRLTCASVSFTVKCEQQNKQYSPFERSGTMWLLLSEKLHSFYSSFILSTHLHPSSLDCYNSLKTLIVHEGSFPLRTFPQTEFSSLSFKLFTICYLLIS